MVTARTSPASALDSAGLRSIVVDPADPDTRKDAAFEAAKRKRLLQLGLLPRFQHSEPAGHRPGVRGEHLLDQLAPLCEVSRPPHREDLKGLRFAVPTGLAMDGVEAGVKANFEATLAKLEELGGDLGVGKPCPATAGQCHHDDGGHENARQIAALFDRIGGGEQVEVHHPRPLCRGFLARVP